MNESKKMKAEQVTRIANQNFQQIDNNLEDVLRNIATVDRLQGKIMRNFDVIKKRILKRMEVYINSLEGAQNPFDVFARVGFFFQSLSPYFQELRHDFADATHFSQIVGQNLQISRRDFDIVNQSWRNHFRGDAGLVTECEETLVEFLRSAIQSAMDANQAQDAKLYREKRDFEYVVELSTSLARKISDVLELVGHAANLNVQL